jgi:hypothetical protein
MLAIKNLNVKTANTANRDPNLTQLSQVRVPNSHATKRVAYWVNEAMTKLIVTWTS